MRILNVDITTGDWIAIISAAVGITGTYFTLAAELKATKEEVQNLKFDYRRDIQEIKSSQIRLEDKIDRYLIRPNK
jgi:hypothetical protein